MIPHLTGKRRKLLLANNEQHEAVYVIVDLDDLMASHNEFDIFRYRRLSGK